MKYSIPEYIDIAESTEAFTSPEIHVLKELLEHNRTNPKGDYLLLEKEGNRSPDGFLIYGPTPMTDTGFDLYWLVVRKAAQRKGIGRKLVMEMEKLILSAAGEGTVRIETSGKDDYSGQRKFYISIGYVECGRIKDFYHKGDDLVIYCKSLPLINKVTK